MFVGCGSASSDMGGLPLVVVIIKLPVSQVMPQHTSPIHTEI